MGVDVTAKVFYGTTKDIRKKLPKCILEMLEEDSMVTWFDDTKESMNFTKKEDDIVKEFDGMTICTNAYEDEGDADFEGFGYDIEEFDKFTDKIKEQVNKVFEKYNLGEPKMCKFEHWW